VFVIVDGTPNKGVGDRAGISATSTVSTILARGRRILIALKLSVRVVTKLSREMLR
jgi:hypothetical protein